MSVDSSATGIVEVLIAFVDAAVIRPLASTVIAGIAVAEP